MFGKIIKIFLLACILVILLLGVFRNAISKFYLEAYADKNFKAICKIKKTALRWDSLSIEGLKLNAAGFDVNAKNITIKIKFQKSKPFYYVSDIILAGITVKIKPLENKTDGSEKKPTSVMAPVFLEPIQLNLQDINIDFKTKTFELDSRFSIVAQAGANMILIKDANIYDLNIRSQDFEITKLNLKRFRKNRYLFRIPAIRIKDKSFNDFSIPVKTGLNQLLFPKAKNAFLGTDGYLTAKYDFLGYDSFCFSAKFQDVSFEKIVDIFAAEDAAFKGLFDGSLTVCSKSFKVSDIQAEFKNKSNGFINVKRDSSFTFLKSYLDAASYNALIDNFKNYEYNIGIINAKKEADAIRLNLDFTSDAMGKRNITINFHDTLGGIQ